MKKTIFLLCLITGISLILRLWNLERVPGGFHEDEVSLGYNAYSILKTGSDQNSVKFPWYVDMFGDFRPALHYYLVVPFVLLFGNTVFAVRIVSALLGGLTPLMVFFLVKKVRREKSDLVPLLSSFLLAVSPWHITLSRAANDAVIAMFFLLTGLYFFIDNIFKKSIKSSILAVIFFFLSFNSYHTPRIFGPLLLLVVLAVFHKDWLGKGKIVKKIPITFLIIIAIPVFLVFVIKGGSGRASQVSIFTTPDEKLILDEQIREDGGISPILTRIVHNKPVNYGLRFISNYSTYFTLDFLAVKGGSPPRYLVPNMGLVYLIEIPFLLAGIYLAVKNKGTGIIWIAWFFLGPLVSATTLDDIPNVQRSVFMLPATQVLIAMGLKTAYDTYKKHLKLFLLPFLFLSFLSFYYFIHQYFHHSLIHRPWYRNNGFIEFGRSVPSYKDKFDRIIISQAGGPVYNYILYFNKIDPSYFQSLKVSIQANEWGFDKYWLTRTDCPTEFIGNVLIVCRGEADIPKGFELINTVKRPDGTPVFKFLIKAPKLDKKENSVQ